MSPHRCNEHVKPQTVYNHVDEREERLRGRERDRVLRRERKKAYKDKGWISDIPAQIAMYVKLLYIHVQLFQF